MTVDEADLDAATDDSINDAFEEAPVVEDTEPAPAEAEAEHQEADDDGDEPAIAEPEEEPAAAPNVENGYVNISNPDDVESYAEPQKAMTHQEQMQMAIDSIERRSKYLDEPNVMSDEAINNVVKQIKFFNDEDYD